MNFKIIKKTIADSKMVEKFEIRRSCRICYVEMEVKQDRRKKRNEAYYLNKFMTSFQLYDQLLPCRVHYNGADTYIFDLMSTNISETFEWLTNELFQELFEEFIKYTDKCHDLFLNKITHMYR